MEPVVYEFIGRIDVMMIDAVSERHDHGFWKTPAKATSHN